MNKVDINGVEVEFEIKKDFIVIMIHKDIKVEVYSTNKLDLNLRQAVRIMEVHLKFRGLYNQN